ncbi:hypothetical protein PENNAL_c0023G10294 [Penicillium nalgiovense]|uniref:Uncharacterized protein n=1 Tax=Penicillium nalgiovense TaxID=60175 RepID=A0A1V6YEK5_PENNA|nr:hypothetical protein PENNAL_c0023G10294 [Penicillium nalgiovense]
MKNVHLVNKLTLVSLSTSRTSTEAPHGGTEQTQTNGSTISKMDIIFTKRPELAKPVNSLSQGGHVASIVWEELKKQACVPFDFVEVPCDVTSTSNNCIWKNGADQCCDKVDCSEL